MTGLDPDGEEVIEIFCIPTDGDLNFIHEAGWGTVIHQPKERMDQMGEWCTRTHGTNGLTAEVIASSVTPQQAADEFYAYITKYIPEKGVALLAGDCVYFDSMFLRKEPYKKIMDHLDYQIIDVNTLKEAARRWCPASVLEDVPVGNGGHRAENDIRDSIAEARYYKEVIFKATRGSQRHLLLSGRWVQATLLGYATLLTFAILYFLTDF
jgi:oligoribonuclease (3'-5' exoribonuclease)